MITSVFFLLSFLSLAFANQGEAFFSNIQISDAYTGTNNCTDLNHLFLIEAELFIAKGSSHKDIFFSVPNNFVLNSDISLAVTDNGNNVATVYQSNKNNNTFGVTFPNTIESNTTATFNFLTKLNNQTQSSIKTPRNVTYSFNTTSGDRFNSTIDYITKDLTVLTTNDGIFSQNGTAWFTADIPIELIKQGVTFASKKAGSNDYSYAINKTKVEVVVSTDLFGNPIKTVPFTAYNDSSSSSEIEISINTVISGGKYVRITYFTDKLQSTPISNSVTLVQSNERSLYSLQKRTFNNATSTTNVAFSNITQETYELITSTQGEVITQIGTYVPITTLPSITSVSTSAYASSRLASNLTSSLISSSKTTTVSSSNSFTNSTSSTKPSITSSSQPNVSSTVASSSKFYNSTITATSGASATGSSSIPAITTKLYKNTTVSALFATTVDAIEITQTFAASVTALTKLVPISTLISNHTTKTYYTGISETVITKNYNATETTSTILIPVSTLNNNHTAKTYYTDISSTVITQNYNATETTNTKLIPISTITSASTKEDIYSTLVSTAELTSTLSEIKSAYTNLVAVSTIKNSTSNYETIVSSSVSTISQNEVNSAYTTLVPVSTIINGDTTMISKIPITSSSKISGTVAPTIKTVLQSSLVNSPVGSTIISIQAYEASAAQLSLGLSGLLISIITLFM